MTYAGPVGLDVNYRGSNETRRLWYEGVGNEKARNVEAKDGMEGSIKENVGDLGLDL